MEMRQQGQGDKKIKITIIKFSNVATGFITTSYITHEYLKNIYKHKVRLVLNQFWCIS